MIQLIEQEKDSYPVQLLDAVVVTTLDETLKKVEELKDQADLLFLPPTYNKEETQAILQAFGKPTLADFGNMVEYGALCAVIVSGEEHGSTAATMLLQAMEGTPVADLPITENQYGKRLLNVDVVKAMGIKPNRQALIGTEFVKTEK